VWAAEQDGRFQRIQFLGKFGEIPIQFPQVLELLSLRFAFGELDHDAKILQLSFGGEERVDFSAEGTGFVDQFLRLVAIVPESLPGHLGVELAEALSQPGDVKETSASGQASRWLSSTVL